MEEMRYILKCADKYLSNRPNELTANILFARFYKNLKQVSQLSGKYNYQAYVVLVKIEFCEDFEADAYIYPLYSGFCTGKSDSKVTHDIFSAYRYHTNNIEKGYEPIKISVELCDQL